MPTIKVRKYGESVYVIYSHQDQKFKVFTGIKVEDKFWNVCSPKKNCPDYDIVLRVIEYMQKRVLDASWTVRNKGIEPTIDMVREEFRKQLKPPVPIEKPFFKLYDEFIIIKGYKPAMLKKTRNFRDALLDFCEYAKYEMDMNTWDRLRFGQFIQYLMKIRKMADSTIYRLVKGLKTFMAFGYPDVNIRWMKYKLLSTEEEVLALKKPELQLLIDADLGGYLEKCRDLFVFLATTGMRYSDSQAFNPSWVTDKDMLSFKQQKTGTSAYPPLYEVSRRVLMKYGGVPPTISNQKFNVYLKELFDELKLNRPVTTSIVKNNSVIQSIVPLSAMVSSQIARSTFASICLESGMGVQYVMQMMGHSDYKSMLPYLKSFGENMTDITL